MASYLTALDEGSIATAFIVISCDEEIQSKAMSAIQAQVSKHRALSSPPITSSITLKKTSTEFEMSLKL